MTNSEIATILYDIAEMLEIKGESQFRIVAYKQAARSVEYLAEDVEDIYKEKGEIGLKEIEGIGKSIAAKIIELLKTNKCQYCQDLLQEIPYGELILTRIPGIGPKTAQKLYKAFKPQNIDDLLKVAQTQKIRKLPGFDQKTEENILININRLKKRKHRFLISFAKPIANEALGLLRECPYVEKCEEGGSLRRMKETIGDIDIVVASREPREVINYFTKLPLVLRVEDKGKTKASVIHLKQVKIDLEILKPDSFGSLLQHLTGSKEHNIHLRKLANEVGLSLSEYGITNLKTKHLEKFKTEKDFYKRLKLSYIEPELREDTGEIEKARIGKLPYLIKQKDIKGDLHMHTFWSDGRLSILEMASACRDLGYHYLAITDHSAGLGVVGGLTSQKVLSQIKKIKQINKKLEDIEVLSGIEANIKANGVLDLPDKILDKLDVVIASVHSSFNQSEEKMTKRILKAIENPCVDIIAHPSGRLLGKREECQIEWIEIFKKAAANGTALEINSFPDRLDLKDVLIKKAQGYGVKFVISTDAHNLKHLAQMKYGVAMARRGWLEKKDVINTCEFKKVKHWLKTKRL
jgi:DNA polymerase (family X)